MNHVSTLKLHQLRLGELPAAEANLLRAHVESCALCRSRQAHQAHTREAFAAMPQPLILSRPRWYRAALFAAPLLAAAVLLAVIQPGLLADSSPAPPTEQTPVVEHAVVPAAPGAAPVVEVAPTTAPVAKKAASPTTRTKGATVPRLEAWVLVGQTERPVYEGEALGAGTRVQLRYDSLGRRYATLAGRDSTGLVEVYATVVNEGRGLSTAPFALTLDNTPGEQVFYAFLTDTRPAPDEVKSALSVLPVRMTGAIITSLSVQKD